MPLNTSEMVGLRMAGKVFVYGFGIDWSKLQEGCFSLFSGRFSGPANIPQIWGQGREFGGAKRNHADQFPLILCPFGNGGGISFKLLSGVRQLGAEQGNLTLCGFTDSLHDVALFLGILGAFCQLCDAV